MGRFTGSRLAAVLLVVGLGLAACGNADEPESSGKTMPASADATRVTATLADFSIKLSTNDFSAGTYTFDIREAGQKPHALSVNGPGVDTVTSTVQNPGDKPVELTVALRKGSYELWCPVGNHRGQGMSATIQVQ